MPPPLARKRARIRYGSVPFPAKAGEAPPSLRGGPPATYLTHKLARALNAGLTLTWSESEIEVAAG